MRRYLQAHPDASRLPAVIPLVVHHNRLADDLRDWADDLRAILERSDGIGDFVALLTYIETVGEAPTHELHELFTQLGPEAEDAYVTTADMLRAEGEARGMARGRAQGEARGRTYGRAEALIQQLTLKFGPLPQHVLGTVNSASAAQLETWTARVLTANTLDEVLH